MLFVAGLLVPAEGLAQNPERYRNGNEEQTETNWAAPAEPRTPRAPVLETVLVTIVVVLLVVFETFAFILHGVPLLIDESRSLHGFDDIPGGASLLIHVRWSWCLSMLFAE